MIAKRYFWPIWALLLSWQTICGAGEAVELRYDLQVGDGAVLDITTMAEIIPTEGDNKGAAEVFIKDHGTYREGVIRVTDEKVMTIVRLLQSGKREIKSSREREATILPLAGVKSTTRLTPAGRLLSARVEPQAPEAPPRKGRQQVIWEEAKPAFDRARLEAVLARPALPWEAIEVNDRWKSELRLPDFMGRPLVWVILESRLLARARFRGKDCVEIRTNFRVVAEETKRAAKDNPEILEEGAFIAGVTEWQFDVAGGQILYAKRNMTIDAGYRPLQEGEDEAARPIEYRIEASTRSSLLREVKESLTREGNLAQPGEWR